MFKNTVLLMASTILVSAAAAHSALPVGTPISGPNALRGTVGILGTQTLMGQTRDGRRCTLSFDGSTGGVLLGATVLGSYVLTLDQGVARPATLAFYFIPQMKLARAPGTLDLSTDQSFENEDPETGVSHGTVRSVILMRVTRGNGVLSVAIKNGHSAACVFKK